ELSVPAAVRSLVEEGVRQIVITTEDPSRYADAQLPAIVEVRHRSELMQAQRELAEVPGVTVLLHDQECAAELRRARKRGRAAERASSPSARSSSGRCCSKGTTQTGCCRPGFRRRRDRWCPTCISPRRRSSRA